MRSAIGFDAKRGDQVEVVNLRFAETPPMPINEPTGWMSYLQFTKDDIMRAVEHGRHGAARPGRAADGGAAAGAPHRHAGGADSAARPALPARPGSPARSAAGGIAAARMATLGGDHLGRRRQHLDRRRRRAVAISNRTSTMIDIAQVQGQVHAQSVQKVGELADKNPHEAVSIIRSWLHEDAA